MVEIRTLLSFFFFFSPKREVCGEEGEEGGRGISQEKEKAAPFSLCLKN